jgi:formylglycine-generating enzyme required for sulfatase activity
MMERSLPFEPEMVLIPPGEFLMGSDPSVDQDARGLEQPQHTLYLSDCYLAKTPVTNVQYAAFVQATGHRRPGHWKGGKPSGKEDHPVVNVTWHDAVAYCNWLAEVTDRPYRLPSEAEWEKGARGNDGRIYPWGNQWDAERCNSDDGGQGDTTSVGIYPHGASPYGLLDMAGNVWEWTRSVYRIAKPTQQQERVKKGDMWVRMESVHKDYPHDPVLLLWARRAVELMRNVYKDYPYDPEDGRENPQAPDLRLLRGGAFNSNRRYVRCASRIRHDPYGLGKNRGFRVAVPPAPPSPKNVAFSGFEFVRHSSEVTS